MDPNLRFGDSNIFIDISELGRIALRLLLFILYFVRAVSGSFLEFNSSCKYVTKLGAFQRLSRSDIFINIISKIG
jgi:hypothetical protein